MLSARDAWQATLGQLQLQLNRATFDTWLKGSELLAYEDGEFVVRVRHAYAKDWLDKHLKTLITQTLSDIFERSVRVNFVVHVSNRKVTAPETEAGPLWTHKPTSSDSERVQEPYSEWDPRVSNVRRSKAADRPGIFQTPLNQHYTFDAFVVGPNNRFVLAAAQAVAEAPGTAYNPLCIYGGVGLGKTHLLQAIGHVCQTSDHNVIYVTAEAFTNEMVMSIRAKTMDEFRQKYRTADVLLIDDVQFMAGKTSTEEEFYHTCNVIHEHNGQIVAVSTCHPRQLNKLDERLRSRFQGGLLADISPPDYETRLAILEAKAAAQHARLPQDVAEMLANHATDNIRELEGLLTQVLARAKLTRQPLTPFLANRVLDKNPAAPQTPSTAGTNLDQVLEATASYHQLSLDDLISKRRTKEIVRARHIAIYLAREETKASFPQIGEALGGRNHSTVVHGYQKISDEFAADDTLREDVSAIRQQLGLATHIVPPMHSAVNSIVANSLAN
ncbi:MAG: chromosomal replication initiator protein DnaA [Anaerolineae bacterium]|nr:chromosomal replication initiator protein DnaA [Anaerolineae bacterium]